MNKRKEIRCPPPMIDGAQVLFWSWSEGDPFFVMLNEHGGGGVPIHGLAICRYEDTGEIYRFSCNKAWEAENDSAWEQSVEAAMTGKSGQYDITAVHWIKYEVVQSTDKL
jgi:hypothetical protein